MAYAIGWLATNSRALWAPDRLDYVTIEFETEIWTSSRGTQRKEAVSATVTYDIAVRKATFFDTGADALEALNTLRRLDREGEVKRVSALFGDGAWTPEIKDLAIFKLFHEKVEEKDIF